MKTLKAKLAAGLLALGALFTGTAHAADQSLDNILSAGKIRIGVMNEVPPYSQIGANNEVVGFDIDVAKALAEALGVEAELVVITAANRIPALVTRQVDLVIATLLLTPQRSSVVAQSIPYMSFDTVVIGHADKEINGYDDIAALRMGVPRGTVSDTIFTREAPNGDIRRFDNDVTAIQALVSGQVDVGAYGELVARTIISQNPNANLEIKFTATRDFGTIGINREDVDLQRWVNSWILYAKIHGPLDSLHQQWLGMEMPDLPAY